MAEIRFTPDELARIASMNFGGVSSGPGSYQRINELAFSDNRVNVKDPRFGAKGDSNGTTGNGTDDKAAIQAAIDHCETFGGGVVYIPDGIYRISGPLVNDNGVVALEGVMRGTTFSGYDRTTLFLDSTTADDYCYEFKETNFRGASGFIKNIRFATAEGAANQGGFLIEGRASEWSIERCAFDDCRGYGIAQNPTVSESYCQNLAIRDCSFRLVAGCFGLTAEPATSAAYSGGTLLTIDNVNLDDGINATTQKPYVWDLRAWRWVNTGIILVEGTGQSNVTSVIAMAANAYHKIDHLWEELVTTLPDYLVSFHGDPDSKFGGGVEIYCEIGGIRTSLPMWFADESSNEVLCKVRHWANYDAVDEGDFAVWENGIANNASGTLEIDRTENKTQFIVGDEYAGRLILRSSSADLTGRYQVPQGARLLGRWDATMGSEPDFGDFYFDLVSADDYAIEEDGDFLCLRLTGTSTTTPDLRFTFRENSGGWDGAHVTIAVRYRSTYDAGDTGTTFRCLYTDTLSDSQVVNDSVKNSTDYEVAYGTGTVSGASHIFRVRHTGTAPTVAPIVRIIAVEAWLGTPDQLDLSAAPALTDLTFTFANSDATPSVGSMHKVYLTGTVADTITDFDNGIAGQEITVISKAAITYDTTGTNLVGSSADIVTASGDVTRWVCEDGTTWRLLAYVDVSVDNSAGA